MRLEGNNTIRKDKEVAVVTIEFLSTALLVISFITGLIVEAVKKILDSKNKKYSSNVLAIIVSVVVSLA